MRNRNSCRRDRDGSVLVAVIVCLSLIGVLMFSALQTSLKHRRQLDRELQMEQTRWLAEAGLVRAEKLLKSADDLPEEPAIFRPKLDETKACEVTIAFSKNKQIQTVTVTATVGVDDRPELQTKLQLTKEVKETSGE